MNIHEYQAKEILKKFGAKIPNGIVFSSSDEIDNKIIQTMHGLRMAWTYFPHFWEVQCGNAKLTPMETFLGFVVQLLLHQPSLVHSPQK